MPTCIGKRSKHAEAKGTAHPINHEIPIMNFLITGKWSKSLVNFATAFSGMDVREPYPTDVSDEEWGFVAPYLTLIDEHAP